MVPTPFALGLMLCDYVIVERDTNKVSFIGSFWTIEARHFPAVLPPFFVCAVLTDGSGSGMLELVFSRLETGEELFRYSRSINFPSQLSELRVASRIRGCSIPAPGVYELTLLVDGEWVSRRRIHAHFRGEPA
jgi:hypothetical protein